METTHVSSTVLCMLLVNYCYSLLREAEKFFRSRDPQISEAPMCSFDGRDNIYTR